MRQFSWREWDYNDIAWAVVEVEQGRMHRIHGTAVPLIDDYFLTARHVVESIGAVEGYLLRTHSDGIHDPPDLSGLRTFEVEADWPALDISMLRVEGAGLARSPARVLMPDGYLARPGLKIRTLGFPHVDPRNYFFRVLDGNVVALRRAGADGRELSISESAELIETSFDCPKGLSGAAVFANDNRNHNPLVGIVIGGIRTESVAHFEESEGDTTYVAKHYTTFGAAVAIDQILRQQYQRATLRDFLVSAGMPVLGG